MARHSFIAGVGLLLAAVAIAFMGPSGTAGSKVDPVKVEAAAGKSDSPAKQVVLVNVSIEKGWHIYANPVGNEDLDPAKTVVQVKSAGKAVPAKINYPAGTAHTEKGIGTYKVYEDKVVFTAEFAKTDGAVEVSVKFQACDDKKCLPPRTIKVNVP